MIDVSCIVAVAENGVMGNEGALPWRLPSDLKIFKALTLHKPLIMGRKTWESLPKRPLPDRDHIVLTRQGALQEEGALFAHTFQEVLDLALQKAKIRQAREIMVIGGREIFDLALSSDVVTTLYLTRAALSPPGDVFFPAPDPEIWHAIFSKAYPQGPADDAPFQWTIFKKRSLKF